MSLGVESSRASETALAVLMFTSLAASAKDAGVAFQDPFGPRLLGWRDRKYALARVPFLRQRIRRIAERSDPGTYGFMLARALYIDDLIRREAAAGLDQLVILGAGYDTRALRMKELEGIEVVEIDHPATSRDKRRRIAALPGGAPENVTYLEVDFTRQRFTEALATHCQDGRRRSLFVLSGVSMYLPRAELFDVFSQVGDYGAERSAIVFDYFFVDALDDPQSYHGAAEFVARVNAYGEEPRCGIEPAEIGAIAAEHGLRIVDECGPSRLSDLYLRRPDGTVAASIFDFGAMVHAVAAGAPVPPPLNPSAR
jgi:methyltransferase (TIGR00027 family)